MNIYYVDHSDDDDDDNEDEAKITKDEYLLSY